MLLSSLSIPLASCWLLLAAFATGQYIVPPIGEYVVPPGTGSGDWADAYSKARGWSTSCIVMGNDKSDVQHIGRDIWLTVAGVKKLLSHR